LTALTDKASTTIIFINQTRMQIQTMAFGNPETTPGGKALKFYTSVRIELKRIAQIKKGEEIIGNRVRAKIVKNKVAPPFKIAEFDIIYNEGVAYFKDVLNLGIKYNIVSKTGSTYFYGDTKLGVGVDAAADFLKNNPQIAKDILKSVQSKINIS